MSLAKKVFWNTAVQVTGKILSTLLGIWLIIIMTRSLGTDGFGAYTTANTYLQFFALFLDMGLNVTLIALLGEHADDEAYQKRCISALFTLRLISAVLFLLVLAPITAQFMPYSWEIKMAIIAMAGSFLFPSLNQVVIGAQQKALKLEPAAIAEIIGRIVSIIGIHLAIAYQQGIVTMAWIITLSATVMFLYNLYHAQKHSSFTLTWDPQFWIMALKRSWPVGVTILLSLVYFKADTFILSLVRSESEVGLYGAAYRVFEVLITIPFMYAGIILPILSNAWTKRDITSYTKIISHSIDAMIFLGLPIIVGAVLLGKDILVAISGESFADAGRALSILSLAIAITFVNVVFSHAVIALDKQRTMILPYTIVSGIALVAYILLIPRFGMWAAAWLTVCFECLITLANIYVAHKTSPIQFRPKTTIFSLIACLPMIATILLTRHLWVGLQILAGGFSYLMVAVALGALPKELLKDLRGKNTTSI